jgi:hypothetical protein
MAAYGELSMAAVSGETSVPGGAGATLRIA